MDCVVERLKIFLGRKIPDFAPVRMGCWVARGCVGQTAGEGMEGALGFSGCSEAGKPVGGSSGSVGVFSSCTAD